MALFFFISGYIGYASNRICDVKSYTKAVLKKCKVQIIPTLVFGLLFTYIVLKKDAVDFFQSESKFGYWFTIALLQMFIVYYTVHKLTLKSRKLFLLVMPVVAIGMWVLKKCWDGSELFTIMNNSVSLWLVMMFFPFFVFGIFASMYKERFHDLLDSRYSTAMIIITFTTMYILKNFYHSSVLNVIIGFPGLLIVYAFFRKYSEAFTNEKFIGRCLQYIGRRTLDIYVLHYFFLPDLLDYSCFVQSQNTVIGIFVCLSIAIMVVGLCLLVSNVLRVSPFLAEFLFGVKKK